MRNQYLLITSLLLLFSSNLSAQDWNISLQHVDSLFAAGQKDSAITIAKTALTRAERQSGMGESSIAAILRKLGSYYYGMADYQSAEPYHKRALTLLEHSLAPNDTALGSACFDLAGDYLYQQKFDLATPLFYRSLQIREQSLGSDHPEVARSLNALAALFISQQKFEDALPLAERALSIWQKSLGPDHPNVAKALTNVASARCELGDVNTAETLYVRLLRMQERILGADHPATANAAIGLGRVWYHKGNYAAAKPLFLRAITINRNVYGDNHFITVLAQLDLAALYVAQANYNEAEQMFLQSIDILERTLGPDNSYVATALKHLASLHQETGRFMEASREYQRSLQITRTAIGKNSPEEGELLSDLGDIADLTGDYASAESLYAQATAIIENALGQDHYSLLRSLNGLAVTLSKEGRLAQAEPVYQRALRIGEAYGGTNHQAVAATLEYYAGHLRASGRNREAQQQLTRALDIRRSAFHTLVSVLPEREALEYASLLRTGFDRYLSGYTETVNEASSANAVALSTFRTKGLVTDEFIARNQLRRTAVSDTTGHIARLNQVKSELSRLFVRSDASDTGFSHQQDSLSQMIDSLEEQLARADSSTTTMQFEISVTVAGIQAEIPSAGALVEYVHYNQFSPLADSGEGRYLAVVLRHEGAPSAVDLGLSVHIDSLILQYRKHIEGITDRLWQPSPIDNAEYARIGSAVVRAIWEPLSSMVSDTGMLLISPDGLLSLVSFAGLPTGSGRYLAEKYAIQYLSSGRDLLRPASKARRGEGLLAIGDPDFDATPDQIRSSRNMLSTPATSSSSSVLRSAPSDCLDLGNLDVQRLPGTRAEIQLLSELWRAGHSGGLSEFVGSSASEESFKQHAPGKLMIHLATHGYYTPPNCTGNSSVTGKTQRSGSFTINPLLTSGLFLAGANRNRDRVDTTGEDGILTAEEVSAMDLTGTERVVLSACESGLGEIASGEGIYGLRRAFLMAGARTVVSALWPVGDQATSEMMGTLYSNTDRPLYERIRLMQLDQIMKLRAVQLPDHPFLWGAFIATGDWK